MHINALLIASLIVSINFCSYGQKCDCRKDMDSILHNIETDYSGFKDRVSTGKEVEYINLRKKLLTASENAQNIDNCEKVLQQYFSFINNGHVYLNRNKEYVTVHEPKKTFHSQYPSLYNTANTTVITIPTFDLAYKVDIDSLLELQRKTGFKENLIIDLRNCPGGGDASYENLIPLIYTNPIISYSEEIWATENNIKVFKDILENPDLPDEQKKELKVLVKKLDDHKNTFVLMGDNIMDTTEIDSIKILPKKVGILVSRHCGSAAEQFLLVAKQSKKVTIFGYENSGGVLDYANIRVVNTPSGVWYYSVPTSRSKRLPEHPVDPIGIAPDVKLAKQVKDPITYIRDYLDTK